MKDDKIVTLRQPGEFADPLTEVLRNGARQLLTQAVEAELAECLETCSHLTTENGRQRLVRHGHMPERTIQTGIGAVVIRQPRLRDRGSSDGERIRFSSSILPPYARRTKSLDALLPVLYLRGISSGDMQEALAALLGKDAPNLSPAVLSRLKTGWQEEYERWKTRDLSARRYVYIWADGVYLQARMEPDKQCILVLIGATPEGKK
jgi:transposase-like protein